MMYIKCLLVRLGQRKLHYIQPLFLFVQMSIDSEMSHQRFRFLLQSGVWQLFLLCHICVLCSMSCHPSAWTCDCPVTQQNFFFSKTQRVTCPIVPILPYFITSFFVLSFFPLLLTFFLQLFLPPSSPLSFCAAFQPGARRPFPSGIPP